MNKSSSTKKIRYPNRWQKGTSGNPNGRPRIDPRIQQLARANCEPAILALAELSTSSKVSDKIRFLATVTLLRAAFNVNFLGHFLKRTGMTAGQYISTPRYMLSGEKLDPTKASSETVNKIVAMREYLNHSQTDRTEKKKAAVLGT